MQLAEAVIDIVSKGMGKVQAEFAGLHGGMLRSVRSADGFGEALKGAGEKGVGAARSVLGIGEAADKAGISFRQVSFAARQVGAIAARAFAGLSGAVAASLKMGAPKEFDDFTAAIKVAAVHLGSTFLPILKEVTGVVNRVGKYFASLTDAQRENILHWVKLAGGVLIAVMAIARLVPLIRVAEIAFKGLSMAFTSTPLGILLAAAGAIAVLVANFSGLGDKIEENGGIVATLGDIWAGLQASLAAVWAGLAPVFDKLASYGMLVWDKLSGAAAKAAPLFDAAVNMIGKILSSLTPIFDFLVQDMLEWVDVITGAVPYVIKAMEAVGAVFEWFRPIFQALADHWFAVWDRISAVVSVTADIITDFLGNFSGLFAQASDQAETSGGIITRVLEGIKSIAIASFSIVDGAIKMVMKAWIALATMVERGLSFKFSGTMDEIEKRWKQFDDKIAERASKRIQERKEAEHKVEEQKADKAKKAADRANKPKAANTFTPELKLESPSLTAISEVWKKAQTSTVDDPAQKVREAQLQESMKQTELQAQSLEVQRQIAQDPVGARR